MTEIELLRTASEHEVEDALDGAYISLPILDKAAALEFFNLMIDTMLGHEAGDGVMWPGLRPTAS